MAASAAASPGSAQIICSATLFPFAQSNEALADSAAAPAPAARTKASVSALPPHVEERSIRRPFTTEMGRTGTAPSIVLGGSCRETPILPVDSIHEPV